VTRPRPATTSNPVVIDTCCLIDLLASGQIEAILRDTGFDWHLPAGVRDEIQYVRQYDPARPGGVLRVPADLNPHIVSGLLTLCQADDVQEQARFVYYAAQFRSDGEAMCLALAESRRWPVATDDRKAIQVAVKAGLTVLSCPELVKAWAVATKPDRATLVQVLTDIQTLAQFRPNPSMPESEWWYQQLGSP
jgi:hypothetical protein